MKKILLFVWSFVFLALAQASQAQHRVFMDSAAIWVEYFSDWEDGKLYTEETKVYAIRTDTIIGLDRYGKVELMAQAGLYRKGIGSNQVDTVRYKNPQGHYVGAIRLDTASRKVYFWNKAAQAPKVLYNFDSLGYPWDTNLTQSDSFLFEGNYYRRWFRGMNELNELTGSNASFMDPSVFSNFTTHRVNCIYSERLGLTDSSCLSTLSYMLSEEEQKVRELQAYPNPVDKMLTLEFPGPEPVQITLMDVSGKRVGETTTISSDNGRAEYDVSHLPSGVYIIRVYQNGVLYQKKLIRS